MAWVMTMSLALTMARKASRFDLLGIWALGIGHFLPSLLTLHLAVSCLFSVSGKNSNACGVCGVCFFLTLELMLRTPQGRKNLPKAVLGYIKALPLHIIRYLTGMVCSQKPQT